jgi:hypothetical protein
MADQSYRILHYLTVTPISPQGLGEPVVKYYEPAEAKKQFRHAIGNMLRVGEGALITLRDENHVLIASEFVKEGQDSGPQKTFSPLKAVPAWKTHAR